MKASELKKIIVTSSTQPMTSRCSMSVAIPSSPARDPAGSFGAGFAWSFGRDLTLALRHPGETMLVVAFFTLVASLFPLGVGADPQLLARIGPGVIWVCALLAAFLSLPTLFATDYADGSLEQMQLSPHPMVSWVSGKIAAHWIMRALKFIIPLAVFFGLVAFFAVGLTKDPREVPSPFIDKPAPAFKLQQLHQSGAMFGPDDMRIA